jgi:excisionase family DNA binding protein
MSTRIHTTIREHRIEFDDDDPKFAAFLRRAEKLLADPSVTEDAMVAVVFSEANPLLDAQVDPPRAVVTPRVYADPRYHVLSDLLARKHVAQHGVDLAKEAAKFTLTVAEAAERLGVHESAVKQAIAAKRLPSWMRDGRHYLRPASLELLELGAKAGKKREPPAPLGGRLRIVFGHADGYTFKVKSVGDIANRHRLHANVLEGFLPEGWRRVGVFSGKQDRLRFVVLEPGDDDESFGLGEFKVAGRFRFAEKVNNAKDALERWEGFEPS